VRFTTSGCALDVGADWAAAGAGAVAVDGVDEAVCEKSGVGTTKVVPTPIATKPKAR